MAFTNTVIEKYRVSSGTHKKNKNASMGIHEFTKVNLLSLAFEK